MSGKLAAQVPFGFLVGSQGYLLIRREEGHRARARNLGALFSKSAESVWEHLSREETVRPRRNRYFVIRVVIHAGAD